MARLSFSFVSLVWMALSGLAVQSRGAGIQDSQESGTVPRGVAVRNRNHVREGKTFALVIGISHYHPPFSTLQFADKDAEKFVQLLKQPLGGSLRGGLHDDEIRLLTNESATRARIDDAVKSFIQPHASPNNTLVLFVAAHGVDLQTESDPVTHRIIEHEPYIVTYNGEQQDLKTSSYPMGELRRTAAQQATVFGHVFVFVDVCHAANVAGIEGLGGREPAVEQVFKGDAGELGMLLAAHAHKFAYESSNFGGGHGAFSYFLISGLSGAAALPGAQSVTWGDVNQYVSRNVYTYTGRAQQTEEKATNADMVIVDTVVDTAAREQIAKAIDLGPATALTAGDVRDLRRRQAAPSNQPGASPTVLGGDDRFEKALDHAGGADALLAGLRGDPGQMPADIHEAERRLHVALDDRGEAILSRYLQGEQVPQSKADFVLCARYFDEARALTADPTFDQARSLFCNGRALIFDAHSAQQYEQAENLLNESIRLDPKHAYAYNALGIAELERTASTGRGLDKAAEAFLNAIRYAPYWAYPVHNLALLESEQGDYDQAMRLYMHAISIAPAYSYLPYNLGLLYERLGDRNHAQTWFDKAREVVEKAALDPRGPLPERSPIWNVIGTLAREQGRTGKAMDCFEKALRDDPDNPDARHNLAVILIKRGDFTRGDRLMRSNLALVPKYMPSWIAHADFLVVRGDLREAENEYEQILKEKPAYVGALEMLARLYLKDRRAQLSVIHLNRALRLSPSNSTLLELRGDAHAQLQEQAAAALDWRAALLLTSNGAEKARLKHKLKVKGSAHESSAASG